MAFLEIPAMVSKIFHLHSSPELSRFSSLYGFDDEAGDEIEQKDHAF